MPRRTLLYLLLAFTAAALFVRLGVWQLSRLRERRARNAIVAARLAAPPIDARSLTGDSAALHYRRVRLHGALDYAHEFALTDRSRNGSPGINILTPLRIAGTDSAVLVDRGWIYSPNGVDADLTRWREGDSLSADGWLEIPSPKRGPARLASAPRALRWLDVAAAEQLAGAKVAPYYVVLDPPPGDPPRDRPVRLPLPALDEGPHRSYAIQWFCFAAIAIVGGFAFARRKG